MSTASWSGRSVARMVLVWATLAVLTTAPEAWAGAPWDAGPFEADPKALVAAAAEAAAGKSAPVLILLLEQQLAVDAEGRLTKTTRLVYRINAEAALEWWSGVEEEWAPWRQARPEVRARVVTADGVTHDLDPTLLVEAPASERDPVLYGDRRVLRAPLPAVGVGAVVEEQHVVRDIQPQPTGGVFWRGAVGHTTPVQLQRFVVTVPHGVAARVEVMGLGDERPAMRQEADRTVYTLEVRNPTPWENLESFLPPDVPPVPMFAFSTVPSWQAVAKAYAAIVERQLAGSDLAATAKKMAGSARGKEQVVRALTDAVHAKIRYTGVHFGDASIVPWTPTETLKRQFGDCKDQATLLVGLLRALGIEAHVALLRTGPGLDVDPRLPGLEGFDHAIVFVPGSPAIWVDPTARYTRPGTLPEADLGRLALVAAENTTELTKTPMPAGESNRTLRVREVFLAKQGEGRVVETIEAWGVPESDLRAWFAGMNAESRTERLKDYVRREFGAKELGAVTVVDPADLGKPFRYSVEAKNCARAKTADAVAAVSMPVGVLLQDVPPVLWKPEEQEGEPTPQRQHDFFFPYPFVAEMQYRITPPPGFAPRPLPPPETRPLGTLTLTAAASAEPSGVVTVSFKLESGKQQLSPAEVEKVRGDVAKLGNEEAVQVWFDQIGEAHLAAGRVREALEEFRKLVEAFPREAIHHSQMARALLAAGMGEEARAEALQATKVEPTSATAYAVLGWVLQHDLIGRRFKPGWDRAGALAAYRKAKELDPQNAAIRVDLAILLEHSEDGQRYELGPDLSAAIAEYKAIASELNEHRYDSNLLYALMWAQRFGELEELAREMKPDNDTKAWLVLARTAREGAAAGIAEAQRLIPTAAERRQALGVTSDRLVRLRLYEDAAALLDEMAQGAPDAATLRARAEMLRKLKRYDELDLSGDDAVSVFKRMIVAGLEQGAESEKVLELFPRDVLATVMADKELKQEFLQGLHAMTEALRQVDLPRLVLIDMAVASFDAVVDGKDLPIQRLRAQAVTGERPSRTEIFLVRRPEGLRILASSEELSLIGLEIVRLVDSGQLEAARQACDWVRELLPLRAGDDPLEGPLFPRVWNKGDSADPTRLRLAGAVLAAASPLGKLVLPVLEAGCKEVASEGASQACAIAQVLALGAARQFERQLVLAQQLLAAHPDSDRALWLVGMAAQSLGERELPIRVAKQRLERNPDNVTAIRLLANALGAQGDYEGAMRELQRLVADGKESASDYNQLAWYALMAGKVDASTVTYAQRAVERSGRAAYSSIHTQAAVFAELGHTTEAYQTILQGIATKLIELPESDDWYVFGRLAEWYGLLDSARRYYARVELEPEEPPAVATYTLAQRRLAALEKTKRKGK